MVETPVESIDEVLPQPLEKAKTSKLMTPETKDLLSWKQSLFTDSMKLQLEFIKDGSQVGVETTVFVYNLLLAMGLQRLNHTFLCAMYL